MANKFCASSFFSAVKQHPRRQLLGDLIKDIDYKLDLYMDRTTAPAFYAGQGTYSGDFIFVPLWIDELEPFIQFLRDYFGASEDLTAEQVLTFFLQEYTREYFPYFTCIKAVIDWNYLRADLEIMFDVDEVSYYRMEKC